MLWRSVWGWVLGGVGTCGGRGGGGAVALEGARRRSDASDVCVVLRVERSPPVACLGSAPLGVVVLVVVCVGFLRRPVGLVISGRGLAWRPVVVVCWVTGLDGGAAGRGVRRVVLCGARGSWGAVGVAGVGAPTLVGW